MMVRRIAALLACLVFFPTVAALAQATGDQSRLIFSAYGGYVPGEDLWRVEGQPLVDPAVGTDVLDLERRLGSTWTAGFGVTYFKGANIGLTADLTIFDTKMHDSCSVLSNSGSAINEEICASIDGDERSTISTAFSAGAIFRIASRGKVSPYLRAEGGVFLINESTTAMTGYFQGDDGEFRAVDIYSADGNSSVSGEFIVGAGVTIPVSKAYHARIEGRATTYGIPVVTGPTAQQFVIPPTKDRYITQFSLIVGIDLVLERKRGRRY